jgi:hypothetical protein
VAKARSCRPEPGGCSRRRCAPRLIRSDGHREKRASDDQGLSADADGLARGIDIH